MDKDRIKGKAEDAGGRIQRQAGEWTGDKKTQAKGMKHQVKGKARQAVGKIKDAGRDAIDELKGSERDIHRERLDRDEEEAA